MFKRFLKFFRGDDGAPQETFEGSYLDHLLQQVGPTVVSHLEETPDHDPLLLVVVGILRHTMINAWSPKLRAPLADSQSPGRRPPPGALGSADESDITDEFPAETTKAEAETPVDVEDETGVFENPIDAQDAAANDSAADEPDPDSDEAKGLDPLDIPAEVPTEEREITERRPQQSLRKTEEIDIEEIRAASKRAAQNSDATMEREPIEVEPADPTVEIEQDNLFETQARDGRPRVDTEEVLQAGRMFLGLLIENDRLPVELQLTVAETTLARDLLLGYFVGNTDFEEKARRLLTLVEQKFGEGLFSQARILLELFHTDEQTRINNDRNLFYEDMILRLGIRRRHRMSTEELRRFETLLAEAKDAESAGVLTEWLAATCLIRFQTFNRDPGQVALWSGLLERAQHEGGAENFLRYLPPRRWRPIGHYEDLSVVDQVQRHVSIDTAREYVISQLKTCYFVLRAVGDTGLEGFLDTFFEWASGRYGLDATVIMPELYKRSMMDPEPMHIILRDLYDEFFAERTVEILDEWDDADVEKALLAALETLGDCDLGEVAPGYYDLGAFTYDQLFGVKYPSAEFPFKIHRLT